jgi:hypothetical protein
VGRQQVTVVAGAYFLRASLPVNVRTEGNGGQTPRLGRINIKAAPTTASLHRRRLRGLPADPDRQ